MGRLARGWLLGSLLPIAAAPEEPVVDLQAFRSAHAAWHADRIERLKRPDGWLSLVGLFWLEPGENVIGSEPHASIRLPERAPSRLGVLRVQADGVDFRAEPGVRVTAGGNPVTHLRLRDDRDPSPTVLEWEGIRIQLLWRNERLAIRVRDPESPARIGFRGIETFPPDPRWRIEARFEPFSSPREVEVPNVLGYVDRMKAVGIVILSWEGREYRLTALDDTGDGRLFLVFADQTNRKETYGAGRFLYTDPPREGRVGVDFNRAYNPPCAFTPYSTCPLPPPENRLPFRIEAGEKRYSGPQPS